MQRPANTVRDRHSRPEARRPHPPAPLAVHQPDRPGKGGTKGGLRLLVGHPPDRDARNGHSRSDQHRRRRIPAQGRREGGDHENGQGETANHVAESYLRSERSPRSPARAPARQERRDESPQRRPSRPQSLSDTSLETKTWEDAKMAAEELQEIAHAIVADGKGILAADESSGTIKKRFDSIDVESTEDTRRAYRELLFTTEGAEEYISGVILYDETIRQEASDGTPFPKLLESKGIIPGIKVDKGATPLAHAEDETITEGLD